VSVFGDDQVSRSEDWTARHPGWTLAWPAFIAALGSSPYEVFRLTHIPTGTTYRNAVLGDLLDEMDDRCARYGCDGDHAAPAAVRQQS
jgi:hypothetical protein